MTELIFSTFTSLQVSKYAEYCISSYKGKTPNKHCPLISVAPLGIHIEISASPLISVVPLNAVLVRIVYSTTG